MARFIPPKLTADAPLSERVVHKALGDLPEPWVVLSNIPMGLFGRPRPEMAELDFLLIHPQKGLCVLEVKGGKLEVQEGTWYQTSQNGEQHTLRRSPFAQANSQHFELQKFLWKHLPVRTDAMAHAVALPDCIVDGSLGPDAPRGITVDRRDLQSVEAAVLRAMKVWKTRASLTEADVEHIVALLKPSAELTVVLAAEVAMTEEGLQRETRRQVLFSESQAQAYESLLRRQRLVVVGEAGTGKTVLAIERAKRLSETGMKTLLLCHRGAVAALMRTAIGGQAKRRLDPSALEDLSITPFAELVSVLAEASGRDGQATSGPHLPNWLLAAVEDVGLQFDALVVDEAQEFTQDQLETLLFMLSDPDESPVYLFADPFQHSAAFSGSRLYRDQRRGRYNWAPPEGMPLVSLVDNVRNSKPIARTIGHFLSEQQSVASVAGPDPEVVVCPRQKVVDTALGRVKQLLTEQRFGANQVLVVAVDVDKSELVRAAGRVSLDLVDVSGVFRFPLPPTDMRIAIGTPDDVQGLEAEIVVVLLVAAELTRAVVRDVYVAASRARSHLVIVSPRPLKQLQLAARAALDAADDES
jgi:hypothetical protein